MFVIFILTASKVFQKRLEVALVLLPSGRMSFGCRTLISAIAVLATSSDAAINVAAAKEGAIAIADSEFGKYSAAEAIDGTVPGPGDSREANRWHSAES